MVRVPSVRRQFQVLQVQLHTELAIQIRQSMGDVMASFAPGFVCGRGGRALAAGQGPSDLERWSQTAQRTRAPAFTATATPGSVLVQEEPI